MNPTEIQPSPDPSRIERLKAIHKLFEQWTLEDGQLSVEGNRSRVEQDARSQFSVQAGIHGIAEPLVDGAFLDAAGF